MKTLTPSRAPCLHCQLSCSSKLRSTATTRFTACGSIRVSTAPTACAADSLTGATTASETKSPNLSQAITLKRRTARSSNQVARSSGPQPPPASRPRSRTISRKAVQAPCRTSQRRSDRSPAKNSQNSVSGEEGCFSSFFGGGWYNLGARRCFLAVAACWAFCLDIALLSRFRSRALPPPQPLPLD